MNSHGTANGSSDSSNNQHNDNITPAALLEQLVYVDTFMPEIDDPSYLDDRLSAELAAFVGDSFVFPDEEKPQLPKDEDDKEKDHIPSSNRNDNSHNNTANAFNSHSQNHNHNLSALLNNNNSSSNNNTNNNAYSFASHSGSGSSNNNSSNGNTFSSHDLLMGSGSLGTSLNLNQDSLSNPLLQTHQQLPATGAPNDILSSLPKVPVPPGAKSSLIAAGLSTTQIDALAALIAQHEQTKSQSTVASLATSFANPPPALNGINLSNSLGSSSSELNSLTQTILGNAKAATALKNSGNSSDNSRHNSVGDLGQLPDLKVEPTGDPEIDKRKRNTAASARFRIKKKLKEQQLERSVRELTELTMTLEKKIQTLEMENRLLRNLVVEKGEQRNNNELEMLKQRAKMASDSEMLNRPR
ncbi:Transcription factor zip1 [Cyberlindnera fabianii]|uniref:Transcription factor zip1 n=1 Tax=Cyberlindnera fabianii TaxID=36022 RepID=A0A1V2LAB4_CYBFA|nr:Transcription factor zip1 [Cyberlindnera fabianii]